LTGKVSILKISLRSPQCFSSATDRHQKFLSEETALGRHSPGPFFYLVSVLKQDFCSI
jgi:hypothetical protein